MSRYIDADTLIKSIESDRNCSDMPSQWIDGVNYAIDLIELYEPTIEVPKWIPCEERLPSEETSVLVTFGYGEIGIDLHTDGWVNNGWIWHDDVIAWMPLPEPWKGTDDGADNNKSE